MRLIEPIFIIKEILSKFNISDDSRLIERSLANMFNAHGASAKLKWHAAFQSIDPIWLQDMGRIDFTKVSSSDDPQILNSSLCLGKYTIPSVISFVDGDFGIYRVSSSSKMKMCYPITINEFMFLYEQNDSRINNYPHYFRVGNAVYTYPYQVEGNMILVLENPLDGYVKLTENVVSGNLTWDDIFVVMTGQVLYDGVVYNQGQQFTCTTSGGLTFTGNGVVQYYNKKRKMNMYDQYPMSTVMQTDIIISILTNEFKVESAVLPDLINDARDGVLRKLQNPK